MGYNEAQKIYQREWRKKGTEEQILQRRLRERLANIKSKKPHLTPEELELEIQQYTERKLKRLNKPAPEPKEKKVKEPKQKKTKQTTKRKERTEESKIQQRLVMKRWHHFNKGGTEEEWQNKIGPKVLPREGYLLLKKVELSGGEIGLVDCFKLCNIYMNLFASEDDKMPVQIQRKWTAEVELAHMYSKLSELKNNN